MPDPVGSVPEDDDALAAMKEAWEMHREVRRKRHDMHELVRKLWSVRVADDFAARIGESMEPREPKV